MAQNGVAQSNGFAIVHQAAAQAHAPQRSGAELVTGRVVFLDGKPLPFGLVNFRTIVFLHGNNDAVPGPDIVQEKIGVGVKGFVAQRLRNGEDASVHFAAGGGGGEGRNVAGGAADFGKDLPTALRLGSRGQMSVARRRLGGTDEAGKVVQVVEAVRIRLVIGFGGRVAE